MIFGKSSQSSAIVSQEMPKVNERSKEEWRCFFFGLISFAVDDFDSLNTAARNVDALISNAQTVADAAIEAYEERWRGI